MPRIIGHDNMTGLPVYASGKRVHKRRRGALACVNEWGNPKQAFTNEATADWFRRNSPRRAAQQAQPYRCPACGLWHLGRPPLRTPGTPTPRGVRMVNRQRAAKAMWRMLESRYDMST